MSVTWKDVVAAHRRHPEWHSEQIAESIGCIGAYVRATARRRGLMLRKGAKGPNSSPAIAARNAAILAECERSGLMRKRGDVLNEIASLFGVQRQTVVNIIAFARRAGGAK